MHQPGHDPTRFAGLAFRGRTAAQARAAERRAAEEREQEARDAARYAAHDAAEDLALLIDRAAFSATVEESDALRTRIEELQAEARAIYGERWA